LRLIHSNALTYKNFGHFFATASRVMRNIIIDSVRAHKSARRGAGLSALTIDKYCLASEDQAEQLFEIDRQLTLLEAHDKRLAHLIELRFFGGLTELAGISHSGIAQLLDGGIMADGSPYLVLEYVDGQSITTYCDRLGLDLEARIRLIMEVLGAVQFAHRNLVVHRDLKPDNIMVDRNGHIKLLDFGIAKLMEDVGKVGLTEPLGARLTLDYAAPEQLLGTRVTAASDVYALGCLSYRLLCGCVPLSLSGSSLAQMVDILHSAERLSLSRVANSMKHLKNRRRGW